VARRRPSETIAIVTHWMGIADANTGGNVHGGVIMRLCDEAAGIAAIRHASTRVVTAGMDRMTFIEPVMVGELVTFLAMVNAVWRTSMEVGVRVEAENVRSRSVRHVSAAYLTMVALDDDGRPTEVPPLEPETDEELRRQREAQWRRDNRLAERRSIVEARNANSSTTGART
jgi:acyl-CoA hydrolase